jgi:ubiquinone/menaquinone biosynthesis C-methylase UbiE
MPSFRQVLKLMAVAATSRSTRVFYDRVSPFYEQVFTDHLPHIQAMAAAVGERSLIKQQIKVLDLACGTGVLTRQLEARGFCVTGLDFSFESLRCLNQTTASVRLVQADAAGLPFGPSRFDVVTCMGAWRHFAEPQRVVDEVCRVLQPEGIFLVGYFPPKLGGIVSVPSGQVGRAISFLYERFVQFLSYHDRAGHALESEIARMIRPAFREYRLIQSREHEYLILAESPRVTSSSVASLANKPLHNHES